MIKQNIIKTWLVSDKIYLTTTYSFNDEFYILFKELKTNLLIYKSKYKLTKDINYWFQPRIDFNIINGLIIEIKFNNEIIYSEIYNFNDRINFDLIGKIHYNVNDISWVTFYEIFIKKEYDKEGIKIEENDVVVDIGANIGLFSLKSVQEKASIIYSIEALPETFKYLKLNTENFNNIIPINKAIYSKSKKVSLYFNDRSPESSILFKLDNSNVVDVDAISFNDFIFEYSIEKIDYLKIDIEGAEFDLFESIDENYLENNIKKIIMEIHVNDKQKYNNLITKISKYFNYTIYGEIKDNENYSLLMITCLAKWV